MMLAANSPAGSLRSGTSMVWVKFFTLCIGLSKLQIAVACAPRNPQHFFNGSSFERALNTTSLRRPKVHLSLHRSGPPGQQRQSDDLNHGPHGYSTRRALAREKCGAALSHCQLARDFC
jgi:hypothetical protein